MLFVIDCGNVVGYAGGQDPIVYLVSTAQAVAQRGCQFVFTDGHGVVALSEFYGNLIDLEAVDWAVMPMRYWSDPLGDPDRKRRRQAEFLVYQFFPWDLVEQIGVISAQRQAEVQGLLATAAHQPPVVVTRPWYY